MKTYCSRIKEMCPFAHIIEEAERERIIKRLRDKFYRLDNAFDEINDIICNEEQKLKGEKWWGVLFIGFGVGVY